MKFLSCLASVALVHAASVEARPNSAEGDTVSASADAALKSGHVDSGTITTSIDFPLESAVGPVRAGLLCLPKGTVRGKDFVRSQRDLARMVRQAASEQNGTGRAFADLQIHFQGLRVQLCAKSWGVFGMGDTQALSGKADFVFAWSRGPGTPAEKQVFRLQIDLSKNDAMPPDDIMREALNRLLLQISQGSQ
ncbi:MULTISPECIES: hypothetical protein [Sphingobium]|nr:MULTISPECIES: hypothetical protein [Sphingobium]MBJ7377781.1 hypothetical protein [Sphingobium sp.]